MARRPVRPVGQVEVMGRLEELGRIRGAGLAARRVTVWLPPGYESDRRRRYPVLYAFDGQNLFEPAEAFAGVDWALDEVITALAAQGRIVPPVVVAIHSTHRRMQDLATLRHLRLVTDHVMPLVEGRYRVRRGRRHAAVIGASLGGLAAFRALFFRPDLFAGAACLSPYVPAEFLPEVAVAGWPGRWGVRLYLDNGGDALDASLQPAIDALLPILAAKGLLTGENLVWFRERAAPHNEVAWSRRVWRPLEFLLGV